MNLKHVIHSKDSTAKGYFNIPFDERTRKVWFWPFAWYKPVFGLKWTFDCIFEGKGSEFDNYYEQLKKEFPVQARIREYTQYEFHWIWLKYCILNRRFEDYVYYPIKSIFKPQNRHLAKVIPRQHKSTRLILEEILVAAFMEYCEDPNCDRLSYENDPCYLEKTNKRFKKEAETNKKVYNYFKTERAELKELLENAWKYKEVDRIEELIQSRDTEALIYIVKNRGTLD